MWKVRKFFKGLGNFWRFRKEIYNFKDYEYEGSLALFGRGVELMSEYMYENDCSASKHSKLEDMFKVWFCTKCLTDPDQIETFRKEKGLDCSDEEVKEVALKYFCKHISGEVHEKGITSWWV